MTSVSRTATRRSTLHRRRMPARNKIGVDGEEVPCSHLDVNTEDWQHDGGSDICGTVLTFLSFLYILATFPVTVWSCLKVIQEYERAVVFRLGRVLKGQAKGPGLFWVIPWLDVIHTVDMRTVSFSIPPQEVITADCVPVRVDGVLFYRVVEPSSWVTRVVEADLATHTLAQSALRAVLGERSLAEILAQRQGVALRMEEMMRAASRRWGVRVERVELKDVMLPLSLHRSMAMEAEAIREARAKMILAEGELRASHCLKEAGSVMSSPVALQLRYLQSLTSVVADDASIVAFPFPVDLLGGLAH